MEQHWLVYWRTYWEKVDDPRKVTADWRSGYAPLYEQTASGDVIWVVVSGGPSKETEWRLLERFSVDRKKAIAETTEGFRYQILGDPSSHEVFDPNAPVDLTQTLLTLDFASGRPIQYRGKQIGRALQHPRRLAACDAEALRSYASYLRPVQHRVVESKEP